jgi:hypothetical protein
MPAQKVRPADYFESTDPAHSKRKTSEQVVFSTNNSSDQEQLPPRVETGRRSFLRGLAALLPLTAVATQIAPAPAAANPVAENPELLRMGLEIAELEKQLVDVVVEREAARARCRAMWPELPEDIRWQRLHHHWFDYEHERDEDERIRHHDVKKPSRLVVTVASLQQCAVEDGRQRYVRLARKLLPIADRYQTAREAAMRDSGFLDLRSKASGLAFDIEQLSDAISKCACETFRGLSIKARALQAAMLAGDEVDHHYGFRAKLVHAEIMARDIMQLTWVA